MAKEDFFQRIGYRGKLENISSVVCEDFELGRFVSNKLVEIGYEDFNYILETTKSKYLVKIFSIFRSDKESQRCADVLLAALRKGVATPGLIKSKQGYLYKTKVNDAKLRLCVMEYIDGEDFFRLKQKPNASEIKFLARQAALIDSIEMRPVFIYDAWAIPNFLKEFRKKSKYLEKKDFEILLILVKKFEKAEIGKLPHCFVHGDILTTNTMRDSQGKIWIIDFSVSNYYPRIQEIAVLACDILFDERDGAHSQKNLKIVLEEYQKKIKLTKKELEILPFYIKMAHSMHVLSANYEKVVKKNNTRENEEFLNKGRAGLRQSMQGIKQK